MSYRVEGQACGCSLFSFAVLTNIWHDVCHGSHCQWLHVSLPPASHHLVPMHMSVHVEVLPAVLLQGLLCASMSGMHNVCTHCHVLAMPVASTDCWTLPFGARCSCIKFINMFKSCLSAASGDAGGASRRQSSAAFACDSHVLDARCRMWD